MRVLLIPSGIPEDYSLQMAKSIKNKNLEPAIILKESAYKEMYPIIPSDIKTFVFSKNPLKIISLLIDIIKFRPNIIHFNDGVDNVSILFLLIFFFSRKIFTTFHDVIIHPGDENLKKKVIRFLLRLKSRKIFVNGEILKEEFIKKYKVKPEKVVPITMGNHNSELFEYYSKNKPEIPKSPNTLHILFFGWIAPRKGVDILLETLYELSKENIKNIKAIIAGKLGSGKGCKELYDRIIDLSRKEELQEMVELRIKRIPWDEGGQLYKWADIVILPYLEISQSGVVGVAYHFSKPVISTNAGALPEIVKHNFSGLVINSTEPIKIKEKLKEYIKFFLNNPDKITEFGKNAKKFVDTEMNWNKIVEKIIEEYKK